MGEEPRRREVSLWLGDDMKAKLVAFYQQNPGVVETVPGLARRIGAPVERVEPAIEAHVALGLLHRFESRPDAIIMFNRAKQAELQRLVAQLAAQATWGDLP